MGLDKDDEIVKRRMAQKMQFLAEDVAAAREPTTAELRSWFEKNSAKFAQPPRLSFRHLYFSPDRRGDRARDDAAQALAKLAGQPVDAKIASALADPFMFQEYYRDRAPEFLGKEMGPQFALAVAKLAPGSWQGPIESGFGWHLVFVDTVIPGRVPAFEEIEADVRTAWLGEQKALAWEKAYKEMRAKYTVLLPAPPDSSAAPVVFAGDESARAIGRGVEVIGVRRIAGYVAAALLVPARRTAGGARPRVAAGVSRDQGDGARPVRGALAHAGAGGHALAAGADAARRRDEPEGARRPGAHRFPRRAPVDRRRAERARRQAHRDPRAFSSRSPMPWSGSSCWTAGRCRPSCALRSRGSRSPPRRRGGR